MSTLINNMNQHAMLFFNHLAGTDPDFSGLSDTVVQWLNYFIIPIAVIIGGLSIFKLMSLGWKITHSSDNPDERRSAIQGLCWWAVGLVLCVAAPVLVNVLLPLLISGSGGKYVPPKS